MKRDGEKVIDQYGAVLAERIHGEWHSEDPAVLAFVMNEDKPEKKRVRARDEKGRLKADDPSTPDINEAWMPEA